MCVDHSCGRGSVEEILHGVDVIVQNLRRKSGALVYGENTLPGVVYDTWLSGLVSSRVHLQCIVWGYIALLARVHVLSGVLGVERDGSRMALFLYERCINQG
jgi:hypothetical protein